MSTEQPVDPQTIEQTKQQIRGLVSEIAQLSKDQLGPEQYYAEFLQRVVSALAAVGGAVWVIGEGGHLELAYQINLRTTTLAQEGEDQVRHGRLLHKVLGGNEGVLIPPYSGGGDETDAGNPTRFLLVIHPLRSDDRTEGLVEIFQRPDATPATQRGYLRFLVQMCELAGEWLKSRKLRQLGDRQSLWARIEKFSRLVHESLDVRQTSYTIANEGRGLIGCDRVSVAVSRGRKCKIEAVSGQDVFDARSNVVALLGRLATQVVATGDPLWYTGSTQDLPPQIEEVVQEYVDETHTKTLAVIPLRRPVGSEPTSERDGREGAGVDNPHELLGEVVGALIVEQIEDTRPRVSLEQQVDLVSQHSARALANAVEYRSLFLLPLWKALGRAKWVVQARTLPKTIAVLLAVAATVFVLCAVPISFDLEGRGTLEPLERRDVFVALDGVVTEVLVKHGQQVQEGEVLAVLRNTDLEVRLADVLGQKQSTREQLISIERALLGKSIEPEERNRLAGQHLQLQRRAESLDEQYKLLEMKREQLTVHSPIAGQVVTWNVREQLLHRPVVTGQVLMTVANPDSEWELDIYMPEQRIGYVSDALERLRPDEKMDVQFITATDPGVHHQGTVREVQKSANMHEEHGHAVRIRVDIDKEDIHNLRPGASVTAKFDCGLAPVGYVWLHEVIEFIQMRLLF